jgi:hypothetical protein
MRSLITIALGFLFVSRSAFGLFGAGGFSGTQQAASQGQTQPVGSSGQPGKASGSRLEDGTPVKLRLQRTVSSADAQVNDQVDFDVLEEIKVGDVIVIPKGSVAWATVTEAQAKRRMARGGKLNVNIDAVRLSDGEKAALRAVKEGKGGGHTGAMVGAMVATTIVFFPAAPLFLFMHGKDITIPKGTEITAYINGDLNLDPAKFGAKPTGEPTTPLAAHDEAAAPGSELSVVLVKSTPDGADIMVDGKFVGSAPSSLRLTPGDHTISLEQKGFRSWQRTITLTPGETVTVNATLEQGP